MLLLLLVLLLLPLLPLLLLLLPLLLLLLVLPLVLVLVLLLLLVLHANPQWGASQQQHPPCLLRRPSVQSLQWIRRLHLSPSSSSRSSSRN